MLRMIEVSIQPFCCVQRELDETRIQNALGLTPQANHLSPLWGSASS